VQVENYLNPLPGVPEKLHEIASHGLPMCILTSDTRKRAMDLIINFSLHKNICIVVTPEDVAYGKPAPDMVIKAAELIGAKLEGIAVVGDSHLDIKMAKAAGAYGVAVTINSDIKHLNSADAVIESLQDISFPAN
jgi:phosphoglycolate phosphatase